MLAHLKGTILHSTSQYLILEVNSVGYKIYTTPEILQKPVGSELSLYIYQKVSDSEISLFGLPNAETLEFFEKLLTVSGVGPKIALGIVSAGNLDALKGAILNADSAFFSQISGVGKKTAERIVVELKDKQSVMDLNNNSSEVFTALSSLGYSAGEIRHVVSKIDNNLSTEEQIKQALKLIGK